MTAPATRTVTVDLDKFAEEGLASPTVFILPLDEESDRVRCKRLNRISRFAIDFPADEETELSRRRGKIHVQGEGGPCECRNDCICGLQCNPRGKCFRLTIG